MRGGAKAVDLVEPVKLRVLTLKDLDAITDIDESLLGSRRRDYWAVRLERADTSGVPSLAAEVSGRVIGFILGSSSGWDTAYPKISHGSTRSVSGKNTRKKGLPGFSFGKCSSCSKRSA